MFLIHPKWNVNYAAQRGDGLLPRVSNPPKMECKRACVSDAAGSNNVSNPPKMECKRISVVTIDSRDFVSNPPKMECKRLMGFPCRHTQNRF